MSDYLQLVGTDTPDSLGSCCFVSDERRVLFNCPEGTQRFCSDARLRVGKISSFFFTRVSVTSVMGLPGFLFTVNDCGTKHTTFGGPLDEIFRIVDETRKAFFCFRQMRFEFIASPQNAIRCTQLPVICSRIVRDSCRRGTPQESPSPMTTGNEDVIGAATPLAPLGHPLFEDELSPSTRLISFAAGHHATGMIVCYALVEKEKSVFDPKEAKRRGVNPGPKYGLLKSGGDVQSDTDPTVVVRARDVCTTSCDVDEQGRKVLHVSFVLDGDDTFTLAQSVASFCRSILQSTNGVTWRLGKVFHLANPLHLAKPVVCQSDLYATTLLCDDWWKSIGVSPLASEESVRNLSGHHVVHAEIAERYTAFPTAAVHRFHLASIAPCFFPLAPEVDSIPPEGPVASHNNMWPYSYKYRLLPFALVKAQQKQQPNASATRGGIAVLPGEELIRYPSKLSANEMLSVTFRTQFGLLTPSPVDPLHASSSVSSPGLLFLGTGSSVPSKYRNVSGIVAAVRSDQGNAPNDKVNGAPLTRVVMDFGEGSLGQLWSFVGLPFSQCRKRREEFESILQSISLVFLSHSHADHNLGVLALLDCIFGYRDRHGTTPTAPLLLVLPRDFYEYIVALQLFDFQRWLDNEQLVVDTFCSYGPMQSQCRYSYENVAFASELMPIDVTDSEVTSNRFHNFTRWCETNRFCGSVFPVDHPAHAHGIVLKSEEVSLLYSGDTRPTPAVVQKGIEFGRLTVLVHEATFDDELAEEAIFKKHSTLGEAVDVARQCGAENCVLTHFSQRYPKLPPPPAAATASTAEATLKGALCCDGGPRVGFAFDFMQVPFGEAMRQLPQYSHVFQALLSEYDSWECGTTKRLREE